MPDNQPPIVTIVPIGFAPDGGETLVNETTLGGQNAPAIAGLAGGGHVIVWESDQGGSIQIYARRFDASGAPLSGETLISSAPSAMAKVVALDDGGYVIVWTSFDVGTDGGGGVYGRRFEADGDPVGGAFHVNTTEADSQITPSVATLDDGGWVISWTSYDQDSAGTAGIYAQRYNAAGVPDPLGEFRVNTTVTGQQTLSTLASLTDGGFVITWQSGDGSNDAIYLQRYNAAGATVGVETLVSEAAADFRQLPVVAGLADGGWVIAWQSFTGGSFDGDIVARRYLSSGAAAGAEFVVNPTIAGNQGSPIVAALTGGGFVIGWMGQDASSDGIFARRYDASGAPATGEFLVNSTTSNQQYTPAVTSLADGGFAFAWASSGQDDVDGNYGVYSQRYGSGFTATEQDPLDLKGSLTVTDPDSGSGTLTVTISSDYGIIQADEGSTGVMLVGEGTDSITVTGTLAQIQDFLSSSSDSTLSYVADTDDPPGSAILTLLVNDNGNSGSGGALEDTETATITIDPVNDAPVVDQGVADHHSDEDVAVSYTFAANAFADPEGAALTYMATLDDDSPLPVWLDFDGPSRTFSGTPDADFYGTLSIKVTASDGSLTQSDIFNLVIDPVADIANDDVSIAEDAGATDVFVLANDTFEGTEEEITAWTPGTHGSVTLNDAGTAGDTSDDYLVYTPDADFNGSDSFTYQVTSGGVTEQATVLVSVSAAADIVDDTATTDEDIAVDIYVLANDEFEGNPQITGVTNGAHGTAAIDDNGTPGNFADDFVTYTPGLHFNGDDSFTYTVTSGGVTEQATVDVTVDPVNDAPTLTVDSAGSTYTESTSAPNSPAGPSVATITGATIADVDDTMMESATVAITAGFVAGDLLSFTASGGVTGDYNAATGVLTLTGSASLADYQTVLSSVRFTNAGDNPTNYGASPSRTIGFTVNDGNINSNTATATVTVTGTNDGPVNTIVDQGFVIQGDLTGDNVGFSVSDAGDINNDGFADFIIAAPGGDDAGGTGGNSGEAYVLFGRAGGFGTFNSATGRYIVDLTSLAPADGFIIQGDVAGDQAGFRFSSAGDVNGDGFDDLIVGAPGGDDGGDPGGGNPEGSGEAYVIFGHAGTGFGTVDGTGRRVLDLSALAPADGFIIVGENGGPGGFGASGDLLGSSVSSAGDINNDGYDDLIVGAPQGDDGGADAGEAYVIFGHAGGFGTIDVTTLTSGIGFVIQGGDAGDRAGTSVSSAGDINNDGYDDLLVGAHMDDDGGTNVGVTFVIFGHAGTSFGAVDGAGRYVLDLTGLAAADGFRIVGDGPPPTNPSDFLGWSVSNLGDINNDGFDDIVVGARQGDDNGTSGTANSGEAYVIFGKASGFGTIDLTSLAPAAGFIIQGDVNGDQAGFTVSSAGDVNGDGFEDILVGAPYNDAGGSNAGAAYVIYGHAGTTFGAVNATGRSVVDLTGLSTSVGFVIQGDSIGDNAGYGVSAAGDLNNDGYDDLIVGARTDNDGGNGAGAAYILYGRPGSFGTIDLTTLGGGSEGVASIAVTGISVNDPDANPATQNIQLTLSAVAGTLTVLTSVSGGVSGGQVTGNGTGTLVLTATQNQINATLGAVNGLSHAPTTDFNGNAVITVTTNDLGFNGTGGAMSDLDTKTVFITAINDAPFVSGDGAESAPDILEDIVSATGQTVAALFGPEFSDATDNLTAFGGSAANTFVGILIVANGSSPAVGQWQYFNGSIWVDIGTAASPSAAVSITAATALRFNPALNFNGAAPTLTAHLVDSSLGFPLTNGDNFFNLTFTDATGGTTAISTGTVVLSQQVLSVNDAPTSTLLSGDSRTYTEGQGLVALDLSGNATLSDVDSLDFDGGSLTVAITSMSAEDILGIINTAIVTTSGNIVSVNTVAIGTFSGGSGAPLVFAFNANATPARIQELIHAIGYTNGAGDAPTGGTRAVTWTFNDGDGNANGGVPTLAVSSQVNVVPVNDPPQGIDATISINEDQVYTFTLADFPFTDAENNSALAVRIVTLPANGIIYFDPDGSGSGAAFPINAGFIPGASDIAAGKLYYVPDADENGVGHDSFTFAVIDNGGAGVSEDPTPNTVSFNVTPVNDAPVNAVPGAQDVNEDAALVFSTANSNALSVSDLDVGAGDLTVTLAVAHGVLTLASLANLSFSAGDGTGDATMTFSGTAAAINAALGAGLTYAPASHYNGGDTLSIATSDGGQTGSGGTLTDSDSVTINIAAVNDAPVNAVPGAQDVNEDAALVFSTANSNALSVSDLDVGAGDLTVTLAVAHGVLTLASLANLSFSAGDGTGDATMTFSGTAAAINAALGAGLTYAPASHYNGGDTLSIATSDGGQTGSGGTLTDSDSVTINIAAVNDAPTVSIDDGLAATEQTPLDLKGTIAIGDIDSGTGVITVDLLVGHGVLNASAGTSGVIVAGTGTAGIQITGTLAQIQAMLDTDPGSTITYTPDSDAPPASTTLSVTVNDDGHSGSGGDQTAADSTTIAITAVNDAPTGTGKTIVINEDTGRTLTAADFGFQDVDGHGFAGVVITTPPSSGILIFDPDGPGGLPAVFAMAGQFVTAAQLAAGGLIYVPAADGNGANYASFTFQVRDDSATANTDASPNTITFDVTAVNDPPVVDLDSAQPGTGVTLAYTENDPASRIAPNATVVDVDNADYGGSSPSAAGHLEVVMTNGINAQDVLSIVSQGDGPGQIRYENGIVYYEGDAIAHLLPTPLSPVPVLDFQFYVSGTTIVPLEAVEALIHAIAYTNTSEAPDATPRTVEFRLRDPGSATVVTTVATINLTAVDDAGVAQDDSVTTDEATAILGASVFGNDTDVDGLSVGAVNGSSADVDRQITLPSGALLTLRADGTFDYNPNHAFDTTPTPGSGAANTPAVDQFSYTLSRGGTAAVTVTITGLDTNDILQGTAGLDVLAGGLANDTYYVENSGDVVNEAVGEGNDRVAASVSYALASGSEVETLEAITQSATNAMDLAGNAFSNTIIGNDGANLLSGGGGSDTLISLGGNDTLIGGGGNDAMYGGLGNDTYYVEDSADAAVENGGEGNDRVAASVSYALASGSEVETLEALTQSGTTALNFTGNEFSNTIIGNEGANLLSGGGGSDTMVGLGGNDTLIGGGGNDAMYGGTGSDTYYVEDSADAAVENGGEGNDRVAASVSYALASGSEIETLEALTQSGTTALNFTGNEFSNTIIGNNGANLLSGGGGGDTLISLGGNDTLIGGGGNDAMYGGLGNDTYYVEDSADAAVENGGEGNDRVAASVSYALLAGSEVETLEAITQSATNAMDLAGNAFSNTIIGNNGANVLNGGGGNDIMIGLGGNDVFIGSASAGTMYGGTGNDTYYVIDSADAVIENVGEGADRIAASTSYTLLAGSEVETLEAITQSAVNALNFTGNAFSNTLIGNNGANVLDGKGGGDVLIGLGGADTFAFTTALGAGNVDTVADFVSGSDKITLDDAVFAGLAPGALNPNAFVTGTAAADADDRIIYNSANGQLFYDADGNGAGAAVLFATLGTGLVITSADFVVI